MTIDGIQQYKNSSIIFSSSLYWLS